MFGRLTVGPEGPHPKAKRACLRLAGRSEDRRYVTESPRARSSLRDLRRFLFLFPGLGSAEIAEPSWATFGAVPYGTLELRALACGSLRRSEDRCYVTAIATGSVVPSGLAALFVL